MTRPNPFRTQPGPARTPSPVSDQASIWSTPPDPNAATNAATFPQASPTLQTAITTVQNAEPDLLNIGRNFRDAVMSIVQHANGNQYLTAEGQRAYREQETERLRVQALAQIGEVNGRIETAIRTIEAAIGRAQPTPAAGVEGLMGRQVAWQRARTLLDAGVAPEQVVDEASDPEMLHALADELPTWMRAKGTGGPRLAAIGPRVERRFADLAPGQVGMDAHAGIKARILIAKARPLMQAAASGGPNPDPMGAMSKAIFTADQARQHAEAAYRVAYGPWNPAAGPLGPGAQVFMGAEGSE